MPGKLKPDTIRSLRLDLAAANREVQDVMGRAKRAEDQLRERDQCRQQLEYTRRLFAVVLEALETAQAELRRARAR